MPDKTYVTRDGFVQFDPNIRDANGKQVTDITIKTSEGTSFRVTIWPELQPDEPIKKGDWVAVDGSFTSNTYQAQDGAQKTSLQISAFNLVVIPGVPRNDTRDVVNTPTSNPDVPF